jgi:hypothetical protein
LYASPNIIRVIKSRRIRLAGHVAHMVHVRNACKILIGRPKRKRPGENLGIDGKIILERILGE